VYLESALTGSKAHNLFPARYHGKFCLKETVVFTLGKALGARLYQIGAHNWLHLAGALFP